MIITIKNFKCFINAKFVFKDNTNYLITATSGYGKSSIFEAIRFVFWGNRDLDIITFGKKKCEVIIEYKGYTFKRTKNPNFFSITSEKLGTIENPNDFINIHFPKYPFKFISFSNAKQMEILNTISSNNNNIQEIKDNLKSLISEGNLIVENDKKLLSVYKNTLKTLPLPDNNFEKPKEIKSSLDECLEKLSILKKEENDFLLSNECYLNINKEINFIEKKLKNADNFEDNELCDLKYSLIKYYKSQDKISKLSKTNESLDNLEIKLQEIKKKIDIVSYEQKHDENIKKEISEILKLCKGKKSFEEIKTILQENNNLTNEEKSQQYTCPECGSYLLFQENKLKISKNFKDLNLYKKIINLKEKMFNNENSLLILNEKNLKLTNLINSKKEYDELIRRVEKINLEDIKNKIKIYEEISYDKKLLLSLKEKIKSYKQYSEEELENKKLEIKNLENKINQIKEYNQKNKNWENNEKIKSSRKEYEDLIEKINLKLNLSLNLIEKLEKIKRIVSESQSASLRSLISIINQKLNFICKEFFTDEINVRLEEFKHISSTKSFKPQIDIIITYKGNTMKTSNLSSGEYARIELALDLVLYDITKNNCPLLLDEVTANLDSETSSHILDFINNYFNDKNIFIIAHQAIEGVFQEILTEEILNQYCHRV